MRNLFCRIRFDIEGVVLLKKTINPEHLQYAQRLYTIGELIIEISNLIKSPDQVKTMSYEDFKVYDRNMTDTIERFEYTGETLASVKAPEIIENEHKILVNAHNQYVESIRVLTKSCIVTDSNKPEINPSEFSRGLSLQKKSVEEIERIAELIGDKLI